MPSAQCCMILAMLFALVGTILPHRAQPRPVWPSQLSVNTTVSVNSLVIETRTITVVISPGEPPAGARQGRFWTTAARGYRPRARTARRPRGRPRSGSATRWPRRRSRAASAGSRTGTRARRACGCAPRAASRAPACRRRRACQPAYTGGIWAAPPSTARAHDVRLLFVLFCFCAPPPPMRCATRPPGGRDWPSEHTRPPPPKKNLVASGSDRVLADWYASLLTLILRFRQLSHAASPDALRPGCGGAFGLLSSPSDSPAAAPLAGAPEGGAGWMGRKLLGPSIGLGDGFGFRKDISFTLGCSMKTCSLWEINTGSARVLFRRCTMLRVALSSWRACCPDVVLCRLVLDSGNDVSMTVSRSTKVLSTVV